MNIIYFHVANVYCLERARSLRDKHGLVDKVTLFHFHVANVYCLERARSLRDVHSLVVEVTLSLLCARQMLPFQSSLGIDSSRVD